MITGLFITITILYAVAFLIGLVHVFAELNHDKPWHTLKVDMFDIPIKKLFFTFDIGIVTSYWVIGWLLGHRTKQFMKEYRSYNQMVSQVSYLEKENRELKREATQLALELNMLTEANDGIMEALND